MYTPSSSQTIINKIFVCNFLYVIDADFVTCRGQLHSTDFSIPKEITHLLQLLVFMYTLLFFPYIFDFPPTIYFYTSRIYPPLAGLSWYITYDTYNFSEELTRCDLVNNISRKNCAHWSPAKTLTKLSASQHTMKRDNLLAC